MKKLNKKDLWFLTIIYVFIISFVIFLRIKGYAFGSNVDWISQHITIPEYFRMLFYETGNLFPQFNMHLGMGQNIFYFFYYGFFSPIILLSYCFPFISIANYIQIISVLNILLSILLLYKWINNKYNSKVAIAATIIFALSGPFIFHSHRHIMFVNYMPFLIGAFISIDYYFKEQKRIPLIINIFLMIMTSFYFSVSGIISLGIYTIYKILKKKKITLDNLKPLFKVILFIVIGILLTGFVLIPTFYSMIVGRSDTTVVTQLKDLLTPKVTYKLTFYYTYSLGLTFIYVVSLIHNLLTKQKNKIFLSIVLLLCILFPVVSYLLNGLMYVDGKVFIPFLPLAIIIISNFINDLFKQKVNLKKLLFCLIPIVSIMLYYARGYAQLNLLITDIVIVIIFLLIILKNKKYNLIFVPIVIISLFSFIILNRNEQYVTLNDLDKENNPVYKELLDNIDNQSIYRTLINDSFLNKVNKIYSLNQYNSSIYSSSSNQKYLKFTRDVFQNEIINKDYATVTGSNNILFNIYSGTKYLISEKDPLIGYQEINKIDNITLYENQDVLPIGYSNSKIMSLREFNTLKYPYNIDALLNYIIVNKSIDNVYNSNVKKFDVKTSVSDINNLEYIFKDDKHYINSSKNGTLKFDLDKPVDNKVLIIKFNMELERKGYNCSTEITINNTTNSLSCSKWKYHNNNYTFEYVLSSNEQINSLDLTFTKGKYQLSDLEMYTIDYSRLKTIKNNISEFIINKDKSTNNYFYGDIDVKEDGYFKLTIPYQKKGFSIYVDGVQTPHIVVDDTFIGFEIDKGYHVIEIKFDAPYLKTGIIISVLGLILFILTLFYNKIKKYLDKIYNLFRNCIKFIYKKISIYLITDRGYLFLFGALFILDLALRLFYYNDIKFYSWYNLVPNLFSFSWILLILFLTKQFKSKFGKSIYLLYYTFYLIIFLVQAIYFSYFSTFFDFSVMSLAGEGAAYLDSIFLNIKFWVIIVLIISILLTVKGLKLINHNDKIKPIHLIIIFSTFIVIQSILPLFLGNTRSSVEWDDWRNPRSVYQTFNDNNKSLMVSGLFEYTTRDFYVNFIRNNDKLTEEEINILEENFNNLELNKENKYTGIFKGKNLVLIQLESIDNFLITKQIMPVTYQLMKNSINFTNHYSFTSGGGSTFNSEFMVNTGYSTAYNYNQNAYSFSRNNYFHSLPNLLKNNGYKSNAYHMNTGEYYSRETNYKSFGYDNYYSLKNSKIYKENTNYWLDTELILNKDFNKTLFMSDNLFMNFIITYSAHMPYKSSKGTCSLLTEEEGLTELECLKIQAKETDDFMKLLLEDLTIKDKLDDTIIVVFTDHYLYTLEDQSILEKHKTTENNLINHTPFFIWSNGSYKRSIKKVNSQLDILPTLLNLLGIEYYPNYYLGRDILSNDFEPIVYFPDGSWYNGYTYVKDGQYYSGKKMNDEQINSLNTMVKRKMTLNDAVMKSDYFDKIKSVSK